MKFSKEKKEKKKALQIEEMMNENGGKNDRLKVKNKL
jgi:hypothetical protein